MFSAKKWLDLTKQQQQNSTSFIFPVGFIFFLSNLDDDDDDDRLVFLAALNIDSRSSKVDQYYIFISPLGLVLASI